MPLSEEEKKRIEEEENFRAAIRARQTSKKGRIYFLGFVIIIGSFYLYLRVENKLEERRKQNALSAVKNLEIPLPVMNRSYFEGRRQIPLQVLLWETFPEGRWICTWEALHHMYWIRWSWQDITGDWSMSWWFNPKSKEIAISPLSESTLTMILYLWIEKERREGKHKLF